MRLVIGHLYPELMNLYGDRGNVIALVRRAHWRGLEVQVHDISLGQSIPSECDLLFIGGGQDREQLAIAQDLLAKGPAIREMGQEGRVILSICGGFQLLGQYYRTSDGTELPGIGLFDAWTVAGNRRCIGDVVVECTFTGARRTLVGFENHSGQTYLGPACQPLGRVLCGYGNNVQQGTEGARQGSAFGTYLHGSLLPKNPWFADHLIASALRRRYGEVEPTPLDDALEERAHQAVVQRIRRRGRLRTGMA